MKQFNVEIKKKAKSYWHKIIKYFLLVDFIANGICGLFGYWSFMFLYFSTFISFSVIFILFMIFYRPECTIKEGDY